MRNFYILPKESGRSSRQNKSGQMRRKHLESSTVHFKSEEPASCSTTLLHISWVWLRDFENEALEKCRSKVCPLVAKTPYLVWASRSKPSDGFNIPTVTLGVNDNFQRHHVQWAHLYSRAKSTCLPERTLLWDQVRVKKHPRFNV